MNEERTCPKLSTGQDSTLGNWRLLCAAVFGEDSPSVRYFDAKIEDQGADMWVVADEQQMMGLVFHMEKVTGDGRTIDDQV
jgi:hypothetical protein